VPDRKALNGAIVPNWLTRDTELPINVYDLAVYVVLNNRVDTKTRERWMSIADIAREARTSRSSVKRALAHLTELGLVEVVSRGSDGVQLANLYRLPVVGIAGGAVVLSVASSVVPTGPGSVPTGPGVGSTGTEGRFPQDRGSVPTGPREVLPRDSQGTRTGTLEGGVGETTNVTTESAGSRMRAEARQESDVLPRSTGYWEKFQWAHQAKYGSLPVRAQYDGYDDRQLEALVADWFPPTVQALTEGVNDFSFWVCYDDNGNQVQCPEDGES
jgi:hypothetical protein